MLICKAMFLINDLFIMIDAFTLVLTSIFLAKKGFTIALYAPDMHKSTINIDSYLIHYLLDTARLTPFIKSSSHCHLSILCTVVQVVAAAA